MFQLYLAAICLAATLLAIGQSRADLLPANGASSAPNFAEISLLEGRVRVILEIDFQDFPMFVTPAITGTDPTAFLSKRAGKVFHVSADARMLSPATQRVEIRDRKARTPAYRPAGSRVQTQQLSAQVIYVVLDYPFDGHPEAFTFTPPLKANGMPSVSIGFLTEHAGVQVIDYRYLSQPETIRPNWDDPWYSAFDNPNLTRHHSSPLMSFIQVQPREIRHEIIFRLRDLETWANLGLGKSDTLDAAAMANVKKLAAEIFSNNNPLTANGSLQIPNDVRVDQLSVGTEGLKVLENPASTVRATAMLGVVLSYPQPSLPKQLEMTWSLFSKDTRSVPVQISDPKGSVPGQISVDDPTISWSNYIVAWVNPEVEPVNVASVKLLHIPHLSLLLLVFVGIAVFAVIRGHKPRLLTAAAASAFTAAIFLRPMTTEIHIPTSGPPEPAVARQIMAGLLDNVSVAMLQPEETAFQAELVHFVLRDRRSDVGAEIQRGLSVALPTGALAQTDSIEQIDIQEITAADIESGSRILASWTAHVSGGHWGHKHRRIIEYRALLEVVPQQDSWMLAGLTILEARTRALARKKKASS